MPHKLLYLVTCYSILKDENNFGSETYLNVFARIVIPKGSQFVAPTFWIGGRVTNTETKVFTAVIKIIGPEKNTVATSELSGHVNPGSIDVSTIFNFIKFEQPGTYTIKMEVDGKDLEDDDRYFFEVVREN